MNLKTIITGILATGCVAGFAQSGDLNSRVIHNYSQAGIGYGFLHEIDGLGIDAHGVLAGASYEIDNFVIGVGGGYLLGTEGVVQVASGGSPVQRVDAELWNVTGNAGYVFRAMGNHLNVIPNIGLSYTQVILDGWWGNDTPDTTMAGKRSCTSLVLGPRMPLRSASVSAQKVILPKSRVSRD